MNLVRQVLMHVVVVVVHRRCRQLEHDVDDDEPVNLERELV